MSRAPVSDALTAACAAYAELKADTVRFDTTVRQTERVALEAASRPDGTFGNAPSRTSNWTPEEQDAHWNELAHAIGAHKDMRPVRRARRTA